MFLGPWLKYGSLSGSWRQCGGGVGWGVVGAMGCGATTLQHQQGESKRHTMPLISVVSNDVCVKTRDTVHDLAPQSTLNIQQKESCGVVRQRQQAQLRQEKLLP